MILDSVGDGMYYGYGVEFRRATVGDSDVLMTLSKGVPVLSSTKSIDERYPGSYL
jgi:hypothetical protein